MSKTKTNKTKSKQLEIIPTQNMVSDLGILLNLTAQQLSAFAEIINTEKGYGIPEEVNLSEFLRSLKVTGDEFQQIYRVAKYYYDKASESECSFSDLYAVIKEIASKHKLPSPSRKRRALERLFTISPEYHRKQKIEPYKQGLLQNIAAVACTHEIRAIFDNESDDDAGEIMGFVPIVTIRLVVEDEKEKRDVLLFTANESSLDELIRKLKSAQDKLTRMKKSLKKKKANLL